MRHKVGQRKDHRRQLLDSEKPKKRPFPVELNDFLALVEPSKRDDLLTPIIAFLRAVPQQKPVHQRRHVFLCLTRVSNAIGDAVAEVGRSVANRGKYESGQKN